MLAVFIIFLISLAGIVALFAHKIYELKKGATLISANVRDRADAVVENALYQKKDLWIAAVRKETRSFFTNAQKMLRDFFISVLHAVHGWLTRFLEHMKGRTSMRKSGVGKNAVQNGSVSFFLKNVADHKEEARSSVDSSEIEKLK